MNISNEAIIDYQNLYKNRFGVELPKDEAKEQALRLLQLLKAIYRPAKKIDMQMYETK